MQTMYLSGVYLGYTATQTATKHFGSGHKGRGHGGPQPVCRDGTHSANQGNGGRGEEAPCQDKTGQGGADKIREERGPTEPAPAVTPATGAGPVREQTDRRELVHQELVSRVCTLL